MEAVCSAVDHETLILPSEKRPLEKRGCELLTAYSGKKALEIENPRGQLLIIHE